MTLPTNNNLKNIVDNSYVKMLVLVLNICVIVIGFFITSTLNQLKSNDENLYLKNVEQSRTIDLNTTQIKLLESKLNNEKTIREIKESQVENKLDKILLKLEEYDKNILNFYICNQTFDIDWRIQTQ